MSGEYILAFIHAHIQISPEERTHIWVGTKKYLQKNKQINILHAATRCRLNKKPGYQSDSRA
jgi:hypothetical protein